jgi:hypothetical protein
LKALLSPKQPTTPATRPSTSNTFHQRRPPLLLLLLLLLVLLPHRGAIRHELGIVLLPLGILERPFASARAALPDAEEDEGAEADEEDTGNGGRDADLSRVRE